MEDDRGLGFGGDSALIDATIIRSVVLPSAMKLLGDRNWYFTGRLEWIPRLRVEGPPDPGVRACNARDEWKVGDAGESVVPPR